MGVNTGKLHIFDSVKAEWHPLTEQPFGYPKWSRDGKYIYGDAGPIGEVDAVRIEIATGRREGIAHADFKPIGNSTPRLTWTANWEPLTATYPTSTQFY